ncbi:MAG: hypothetical protein ACRC7O_05005, partial [Fimbriiglobus sp.]
RNPSGGRVGGPVSRPRPATAGWLVVALPTRVPALGACGSRFVRAALIQNPDLGVVLADVSRVRSRQFAQ